MVQWSTISPSRAAGMPNRAGGRRHPQVAGDGQLGPRAQGGAVDGGDERSGIVAQRGQQLAQAVGEAVVLHPGEVGAGAEVPAGSGEHHHPRRAPWRPGPSSSWSSASWSRALRRSGPVDREHRDRAPGPRGGSCEEPNHWLSVPARRVTRRVSPPPMLPHVPDRPNETRRNAMRRTSLLGAAAALLLLVAPRAAATTRATARRTSRPTSPRPCSGGDDGFDKETADCFADLVIDEVGLEELKDVDLSADEPPAEIEDEIITAAQRLPDECDAAAPGG